MKNIDGEIIVIDNKSTDGSRNFFQDNLKKVQFIWNDTNSGFAKANNQALKIASGEYILFLNPDTIIPEDCFEKCISFIKEKNNKCAIGIKMLDGSGNFLKESKRAFPSPLTSLFKLSGLAGIFPHSKLFAKYHLGYLSENENHEVDVLAGAFMMVPKKILVEVGGFDEDFFMYGEDIDLSFRIQKAGFKNFYFSESTIIHFKGESTKKGSLNYVKMFYKAMSVFVKKHYGGARAGLFNSLIQTAIFMRAGLAAIVRFLRWVGLPVIDAASILLSFGIVKFLWSAYIKQEINYSPNLLLIAFPAFTILFLAAAYFAGLYDNGFKQSRLNKSALIATLVILSVYSLLPESLRFSRGILLFGSLMAFLLITLIRRFLLKGGIIESAGDSDETNQTVIAGTAEEFKEIKNFMENSGRKERILGRINIDEKPDPSAIGNLNNLKDVLRLSPVKEIIFSEGQLSFKTIIDTIPGIPHHIKVKYFAKGSHTIIGSDDKNEAGDIISGEVRYRLADAVSRRAKNLFDVAVSLCFLISFPIHFFIKKRPFSFFSNTFKVLFLQKTWVGYAIEENNLPQLTPGIISTTGLPACNNALPRETLAAADKLYARHYTAFHDFLLVLNNYHFLS